MKKLTRTLFVLMCASAFAATTVSGQLVTIKFDEMGNVSLNGAPAAPGVLAPDPISGMIGLKYDASGLGVRWTPGDVLLLEPAVGGNSASNTVLSDLVRFEVNPLDAKASAIFFFSLADEDPPQLADVPVLPPVQPNFVTIDEVGPEGNNGAFYWPQSPNFPGYVIEYPGMVAYNIISDVPEPSALALVSLFGALLAPLRRRQ